MMAAIRNFGKTSDKFQQFFKMAPELIGEMVVASSAPDTTRRAILSGSLVESPDIWVATVIQDYRGGGFRRENAIYRSPYSLCNGHSRRITLVHSGATEAGDGWKFITVVTGKYASLTLGEIYDTLDKAAKEKERKRNSLLERKAIKEEEVEEQRAALEQSIQALAALQHEIEAL
jgi:hypothetical protein